MVVLNRSINFQSHDEFHNFVYFFIVPIRHRLLPANGAYYRFYENCLDVSTVGIAGGEVLWRKSCFRYRIATTKTEITVRFFQWSTLSRSTNDNARGHPRQPKTNNFRKKPNLCWRCGFFFGNVSITIRCKSIATLRRRNAKTESLYVIEYHKGCYQNTTQHIRDIRLHDNQFRADTITEDKDNRGVHN